MRHSLQLLLKAARINPTVQLRQLAADEDYGDALAEIYGGNVSDFTLDEWDALLDRLDSDEQTIADFMQTPGVCALIRAEEQRHAAA